jgi:hypothetical protein
MKLLRLFAVALALLSASPAIAQTAPGFRPGVNVQDTNPEPVKTMCYTAGAWAPCSSGASSGSASSVAQGSTTAGQNGDLVQGAVITGDAAYTAGTTQPLTLTPTGRLKVGLSSATNIIPAPMPATTLTADLVACRYRVPVTWTPGDTGGLQCDSAGNLTVNATGNAASAAADSGNPLKIGGVFNTTLPTVTTGQRVDAQFTARGEQLTALSFGGTSIIGAATNSDAVAATSTANSLRSAGYNFVFNGTTWDRARGDTTGAYVIGKGGSNMASGQVSVGTTATLIAAARPGRQKIAVTVTTATQCAFGGSTVTLTTGFPLAPVAYVADSWDTSGALYAVCATAATTVGFRELF